MKIKLPTRDRYDENREKLTKRLNEQLSVLSEIKSDLVKMQKYELTAKFREIEKLIKKSLVDLKNIAESTTHNTV